MDKELMFSPFSLEKRIDQNIPAGCTLSRDKNDAVAEIITSILRILVFESSGTVGTG
jgi:hypothetical protein